MKKKMRKMKTLYIIIWIELTIYHYKLNRHPSPIGRGWEYINGKCHPVRYAVPAMADVLQPQPQALSTMMIMMMMMMMEVMENMELVVTTVTPTPNDTKNLSS